MNPLINQKTMDRDNLQAQLDDIFKLSMKEKIASYERLFDEVDLDSREFFETKDGEESIVFEVERRINLIRKMAKDANMEEIEKRAERLIENLR